MRYKISKQALDKILRDLGDAKHFDIQHTVVGSFRGQVIDTAKWYLSLYTKKITYTAVVTLNANWEKDWEIEIEIDD